MKKNSEGQVALVVLLVSAVLLTFGLSISRKSVSDVKINTDEELLKQAFNTAESGVDYYLSTGSTGYTSSDNKSKADISVSQIGGGSSLSYGQFVKASSNADFWLVAHDPVTGTLNESTFYGGNSVRICVDIGFSGALKVDYFYKTAGVAKVDRFGFNFGSVNIVNNYTDETAAISGSCAANQKGVDVTLVAGATQILLNVEPLFTGTNLDIVGNSAIPAQGEQISSLGKAGNLSGPLTVSRKVSVFNRYQLPQFMFDGLTSGGSVTGN